MTRAEKRKDTKKRRKGQRCRVFEMKIDKSHLSKKIITYLHTLFKEAKWFYNHCLACKNDNKYIDPSIKQVPVLVIDHYEIRTFTVLSSQMKQDIKDRMGWALAALHELKEKGYKVGRLRYKSWVNSVPLRQLNFTYYLDVTNNRIKIQLLKKWLRVRGLEQIPKDAELANAVLVRKSGNFYLHITTYTDKEQKVMPDTEIGIDFGCATQLSFDNGVNIEFQVIVNDQVRRLDRKIMKKRRKKSNNKWKDQCKREKQYEEITNKKGDIRKKVVYVITKFYKYVNIQDENIHGWAQTGHGKKIQNTGIGGIISDLKSKSHTLNLVHMFYPSTKLCPVCNKCTKHSQDKRTFLCDHCGYTADRDQKSAFCIKREGMKNVPTERREVTLGETLTSAFYDALRKIHGIKVSKLGSLSQEAPTLLGSG